MSVDRRASIGSIQRWAGCMLIVAMSGHAERRPALVGWNGAREEEYKADVRFWRLWSVAPTVFPQRRRLI